MAVLKLLLYVLIHKERISNLIAKLKVKHYQFQIFLQIYIRI